MVSENPIITLAKTELLYPKNAGAQVAMDFKWNEH